MMPTFPRSSLSFEPGKRRCRFHGAVAEAAAVEAAVAEAAAAVCRGEFAASLDPSTFRLR
jgi:hypothetical protein